MDAIQFVSSDDVSIVPGVTANLFHFPRRSSSEAALRPLGTFARKAAGWDTVNLDFAFVAALGTLIVQLQESSGIIIGCGALVDIRSAHPWLANIVVSEQYRRNGLGAYIVQYLLKRQKQFYRAKTVSLVASAFGRGIYERLEFKFSSRWSTEVLIRVVKATDSEEEVGDGAKLGVVVSSIACPSPTQETPALLNKALDYFADVSSSQNRRDFFERLNHINHEAYLSPTTTKAISPAAIVLTDEKDDRVVAASWIRPYDSINGEIGVTIGPVAAQTAQHAELVVKHAIRHAQMRCKTVGWSGYIKVLMISVNNVPNRSYDDIWSGLGFEAVEQLQYMTLLCDAAEGQIHGESPDGDKNQITQKCRDGELGFCDMKRYFCLSGFTF